MAKRDDPTIHLIGKVPIFSELSRTELGQLRDMSRIEQAAPGTEIVTEGHGDRRLYIVLSGDAEVSIDGTVRGQLTTGDHFGEIGVLDGGPRTATVTARSEMQLLSLAHFNVRSLLKEQPDIALKVLAGVCAMVRRASAPSTA